MTDITKMDIDRLELLDDVIKDELYNHQGSDGDGGGREDIRKGLKMLKTQVRHRINAMISILKESK